MRVCANGVHDGDIVDIGISAAAFAEMATPSAEINTERTFVMGRRATFVSMTSSLLVPVAGHEPNPPPPVSSPCGPCNCYAPQCACCMTRLQLAYHVHSRSSICSARARCTCLTDYAMASINEYRDAYGGVHDRGVTYVPQRPCRAFHRLRSARHSRQTSAHSTRRKRPHPATSRQSLTLRPHQLSIIPASGGGMSAQASRGQ
jgi:hypothetical protein